MWKGPGQDPGGGPDSGPPPGSSQELSDLKDQFEQQQVLIAQLKEMIRKNEQSSVTQEKVEEYMNTLSKRGGKPKRSQNTKTVDIPASQKITLLRQQVEENKARLAERGKSKKGIEDMVTQLQAQLDDSQQLISQTPLNVSLDTKVEYSENSTAQELYMVLLTKEKRISDLIAKTQKLESSVLDLQENVKEKDSVIDARTKAITLMTENLSRKGKTTLDALDETKEQMRKMQESFITMEADMKARQMKLLEDLRQKNYEIAELQEVNARLSESESKQPETEEEVEVLKAENLKLLENLKRLEDALAQSKQTDETENEEINKLKKQLEESNKNMIKVKAQHKSKLKELTKKIDAFKKISDVNAELVKLEGENSRLNQKIAELEEEKGTLQLKLVESDSVKGSDPAEQNNELEDKIQDLERNMEEKDKVISILESEISRSKAEIETLSEKLSSLSHLENAQVTSEMASIQYEEQMERLETDNKKLTLETENLAKERDDLLESIEQLKKEKQEISTKLDHYIQENMELIDKLEKLSAEKVSSAESIEIVEGLTQQEKLELEAYQKNLDLVAGNLKASEENLPQADLNESVNELTEETSELLQKIELFTVERREVMEKMEQLKQENLNLGLKIKEIENNRDVLAETYEQLQSEKEVLDAENAALKERLEQEGNERLKEELEVTKKLLEEKQAELESLTEFVKGIEAQLDERNNETSQLNNTIIELNRTLADLENDNKSLQMKITQVGEELEAISNKEWENRRLLESKDNEITKLMKERDNTESVILDLQKTIKDKEDGFHKITSDLKNKYLTLHKQLEANSDNLQNITAPLQIKIEELTGKNKEQLEKMKKIAANLKKKTQAYQELDDKFKEAQNRHEVELKTSLQQLQELESEVSLLRDKAEEARVLEEKNVELQNIITDLKIKVDKSNEVSLQQELLLTKENLGSVESTLRAKIQELEMIVETLDSELVRTRQRCSRLEEGISFVEERRLSLERKASELGAQLEEKAITCEEISRSEDMLEQRLAALTAHDEAIEKKLQDAITENQELTQRNQKLEDKNEKLKKKLEEFREKVRELDGQQNIVEEFETHNENLKKQVHNLENDLKTLQNEYERMLEENKNDFDKVNGDWQAQFDEVLLERSELLVKCEKFEEELGEIAEKEIGFGNELIEYKTKLEASEEQIERLSNELKETCRRYEERIQALCNEKSEVEAELRTVIEEKERVFEEDLELRRLIEEKEKDLEVRNEREVELRKVIEEKEKDLAERKAQELKKLNEEKDHQPEKREIPDEIPPTQPAHNTLSSFFGNIPGDDTDFVKQENLPQVNIPTFVWGGQSTDPFDFVQPAKVAPQQTFGVIPENNQKELQEKIKTLEFMLYNVEKEKEDTLDQCQQLTNELGCLIYEKQMPSKDLESQIVSEADIAEPNRQELQQIEFEEVKPVVTSSDEPVQEEACTSKEAYVCTFGENDDGWGWGPEEAKLEEEHAQKSENVEEFKNRIRVLEMERENHMEEIRQLQVKSGKLIKKLKEFKAKNEELSQRKKSESDFFNLDDTIQEELKLQIQQVEKKLKETTIELEKEKHEKVAILKRVDVLTAANERMVEMKEKQDIDLLGWQQNCRELSTKLERLEWGVDGFSAAPVEKPPLEAGSDLDTLRKKIDDLNETIKDLTLDNEELQALLEEQRNLRLAAERSINQVDHSNEQRLDEEKKLLQDHINELIKKNADLEEQLQGLERQVGELDGLRVAKDELKKKLDRVETENGVLLQEVNSLRNSAEEILQEKEALRVSNDEKSTQIKFLLQEHERLFSDIQDKRDLEEKNTQIDSLQKERDRLLSDLQDKKDLVQQLEEKEIQIDFLQQERDRLFSDLQNTKALVQQLEDKTVQIDFLQQERDRLFSDLQNTKALVQQLEDKTVQIDSLQQDRDRLFSDLQNTKALVQQLEEKNTQIDSLQQERDRLFSDLQDTKDLVRELEDKNAQIDSLRVSVDSQTVLQQEKELLFKELQEKNVQIDALKESVDAQVSSLRQELDKQMKAAEVLLADKNALTESLSTKETEIVRLSAAMEQMTQEWDLRIDQRGADVAESWKLHLESRESEFAQIEQHLRKEMNELEEKCNALVNENNELRKNVDAEIRNEVDRVAALQQQINDRQQYINELTRTLQEKQGEVEVLQSELQTAKKYLDDEKEIVDGVFKQVQVERNKESLLRVFGEKEATIVNLRHELEETKASLAREIQSLEERNQALVNQLQEIQNLKDYENENIQNLQQNLLEYQQINGNFNTQLEEKGREIMRLKHSIEEKEIEYSYKLENLSQEYRASITEQSQEIETLKRRLAEHEYHYEELVQSKVTELESVRFELHNRNSELAELTSQLQAKYAECSSLQQKIDEQTALIDEENKQLTELRAIIEEQVLKIEELKKELFEKSNDYDSLIAEMDISRSDVKETRPREESEDLTEPVSRAELDLALYMLHQRDVRCEELTVELTQLLEERDTLQLRLSNVIREKEELGRKIKEGDEKESASGSGVVPAPEVAVEALDSLTTKLSELKTVGYKKDKTIVDEQDLRRLQQFSIMQQHRDAASKLPPEAAARLVDASYTLSRDVQSPSKVLLNWLWGRSTPKVNNI